MSDHSKTIDNMLEAYQDEVSANAKYKAFSEKAQSEGFQPIAVLYQAVSAAEKIHAGNHRIVIMDAGTELPAVTPVFQVKSTKENLAEDIHGEAYEADVMYPGFLLEALEDDNPMAHLSLSYAMKTERKHKLYFESALDNLELNTLHNLPAKYSVCPACGNTFSLAPLHCEFCLCERDRFEVFQ